MVRAFLGIAVLVVVAACESGGSSRVGNVHISDFYSPSLVGYVNRNGTFPTAIYGNPFSISKADADRAIRAVRSPPEWAGAGRFVQDAIADQERGLRLVLVFNPDDRAVGPRRVCASAGNIPTRTATGETHVLAAFCRDNEWNTFASIRVAQVKSPDGAALGDLMSKIILHALPFKERRDRPFDVN
jgi:hypothetical protein